MALLRIARWPPMFPLELAAAPPDPGDPLFAMGFRVAAGTGLTLVQGALVARDVPLPQSGPWTTGALWSATLATGPGFSGAPVVNDRARVVGFVVGSQTNPPLALVRPIAEGRDLLAAALP